MKNKPNTDQNGLIENLIIKGSTEWFAQRYYSENGDIFARQKRDASNWTPWQRLMKTDERIGIIFHYGGLNPPEGALLCDGRFVKISDYPKLFNIIGHRFNGGGVDPNNGMFALPDAINRYLRGAGGDKRVGLYEEDAIRSHSHNVAFGGNLYGVNASHGATADGALSINNHQNVMDRYSEDNVSGRYDLHLNINQNTAETGAEETRGKGLMALTCIWFE